MFPFEKSYISIWLWLCLPLIAFGAQITGELLLAPEFLNALHSENGCIEITQVLVMAVAFFYALRGLCSLDQREAPFLTFWLGCAALGSFYVFGEEISWGQHVFGWSSGEFWQNVNDQNETNLHNTSSWLDQKPRLLLELGVIFGGTLIPLVHKYSLFNLPARFKDIYPPTILVPVAMITLALKISDKILETVEIHFFTRISEVIELFVFYYVCLYVVNLSRHVRRRTKNM